MHLHKRTLAMVLTCLVLLSLAPPAPARAAEAPCAAPMPFAFSNAERKVGQLMLGGYVYYGAIRFAMGKDGGTAEATYNLGGLYEQMSFETAHLGGETRRVELTVLGDGKELYTAHDLYELSEHSFGVTGVTKLTLRFQSPGEEETSFAVVNAMVVPVTTLSEERVRASELNYDENRYLLKRAELLGGHFSMGGYRYENGYLLTMGDTGIFSDYTASICFNLEGRYQSLSFDIAKFMNRPSETVTRSAFLTVEGDGKVLPGFQGVELKWDDVSRSLLADVTGVRQLTVSLLSCGTEDVQWALGNIRFTLAQEFPEPEAPPAGIKPPEPFAVYGAEFKTKPVEMAKRTYSDAIAFTMGQEEPALAEDAEITYNLMGVYGGFTFDAGFLEGDQRNAILGIYLDDVLLDQEWELSCLDLPRRYTVDVTGVHKLTIRFRSEGTAPVVYAMGNVRITTLEGTPADTIRDSNEQINAYKTGSRNTRAMGDRFSMGGCNYRSGFVLTTGEAGDTAKLVFRFDGTYKAMTLDLGRLLPEEGPIDRRSASITIKANGVALEGYDNRELRWNDVPMKIRLNLENVQKLTITLVSPGEMDSQWAMGAIWLGQELGEEEKPFVYDETVSTPGYRLYNRSTTEHFYTVSVKERDTLLADGWEDEGIAWLAPLVGDPVYRLYNKKTREHHFTTNLSERDTLRRGGWTLEGVAWFSAPATEVPVYRLLNPAEKSFNHHFTASLEERDALLTAGWVMEGVGWYGLKME